MSSLPFLKIYDLDYGIQHVMPEGWSFHTPSTAPIRYSLSPDSNNAIVAAVLELDIVEKGLRAISKYITEEVMKVRIGDAKVLYNIEEPGYKRRFSVMLVDRNNESAIIVFGILQLVTIKAFWGTYQIYFLKCIVSKEGEETIDSLSPLLDHITKDEHGIGFTAPIHRYTQKTTIGFPPYQMNIWAVDIPISTITYAEDMRLIGLNGTLAFLIKIEFNSTDYMDESYLKSQIYLHYDQYLFTDKYEILSKSVGKYYMHAKIKGDNNRIMEVHIFWIEMGNNAITTVMIFAYPETATYGAKKVIDTIIKSWNISSEYLAMITPPAIPSPSIMSSISTVNKEFEKNKTVVNRRKIPIKEQKRKDKECKSKIMILKNEIENVKMQLRALEYDYKTRLEALNSIKQSDVITGMYTFQNPANKLRFIHSKTRSPVIGDRFWEHKDKIYLENKSFLVTSSGRVPYMKHQYKELKWKVEEEKKKLKKEYENKKKELEKRLRELEEELKKCQEC